MLAQKGNIIKVKCTRRFHRRLFVLNCSALPHLMILLPKSGIVKAGKINHFNPVLILEVCAAIQNFGLVTRKA
jgi:hypothetical protein